MYIIVVYNIVLQENENLEQKGFHNKTAETPDNQQSAEKNRQGTLVPLLSHFKQKQKEKKSNGISAENAKLFNSKALTLSTKVKKQTKTKKRENKRKSIHSRCHPFEYLQTIKAKSCAESRVYKYSFLVREEKAMK